MPLRRILSLRGELTLRRILSLRRILPLRRTGRILPAVIPLRILSARAFAAVSAEIFVSVIVVTSVIH